MPVRILGTLTATGHDIERARQLIPEHIALSRAEPGCLRFELTEDDQTPGLWRLDELFADQAAFDHHQQRTRASIWGRESGGMVRDFTVTTED